MKSLFESSTKEEVFQRIDKLNTTSTPVWGKMNSSQMFAHCTAATQYACGDYPGKQIFIGKIIGTFLKPVFYNEKPFGKNSPTAPHFTITDQRDFEKEKKLLKETVARFSDGGPSKVTRSPHMFFGKLTPEQWGIGMYKHMDHHLRQFGV